MDLQFSEEQRLLRDSVDRFVAQAYDFARRRRIAASPTRRDPDAWAAMAGFGWLALSLPEAHGGLGGGAVDAGILMEGLGRGLVLEPVAGAVVAGALLADLGSATQQAQWLARIAEGSIRLAFAPLEAGAGIFAAATAPATRAVRDAEGWRLDGRKLAVLDAPGADGFIVPAQADGVLAIFIVPAGVPGLRLDAWETQDDRLAAALEFDGVRLGADARLAGDGDAAAAIARALDLASAAACAEALGCMKVLLETTVAYTREREQFGQPLAASQVLRHRMVDMAVACEEAGAIALRAALACDARPQDPVARARAVSGARVKLADAARYVAREAVQLHGAMGVTDELNVGAYYRRLLCLETSWGTRAEHLARCVDSRRAPRRDDSAFDASFSADELAFRGEVRAFIAEHLPAAAARAQRANPSVFSEPDVVEAWQRALDARGWVAPGWPVEHGGPGWTPAQRFIFDAECARADAPVLSPLGLRMVGPVIIGFGTPRQQAFYLPRIRSGEDIWCQGYSEPGSGSDLASLRTRAVVDGDFYVVNGSKIWTTHAHHANRMFALVRTGDGPRKQDGISFLLIDMDTPGITIRPIRTMGGDHEVNQVFFDDVRVPVANRVGEEGQGWTYGKYLLQFERGGALAASRLRRDLQGIEAAGRAAALRGTVAMADDPLAQSRIVAIENDIDALETMELRIMSALQTGETPGAVSSLLKLRVSEIRQALTALGVELVGVDALVRESRRPLHELEAPAAGLPPEVLPVVPTYLNSRAYTIFGGTSEIQRDIIAKTMLGL